MKITIKPRGKALSQLPTALRQQWHDALQTSNKFKRQMCNSEDTEHCCLCVLARLEGAEFYQYMSETMPMKEWAPYADSIGTALSLEVSGTELLGPNTLKFPDVNDGIELEFSEGQLRILELTHPQIAELVMGREVELEFEDE